MRLINVKSLKCTIGPGNSADWNSGFPRPEKTGWGKGNILHFDSINLKTKKARIIGNRGATDVVVMMTLKGIHFLEGTGSGNIIFSTVFFHRTKKGYAFVTSRHLDFGFGNGPFPSQFHGTCKIFD